MVAREKHGPPTTLAIRGLLCREDHWRMRPGSAGSVVLLSVVTFGRTTGA